MKKRNIKILAIASLFILIFTYLVPAVNVYAHNIPIRQFSTKLEEIKNDYPTFYQSLIELKRKHPNWNFQLYNTNWDWDRFINFQTSHLSRSLIESNNLTRRGRAWVDPNYIDRSFDTNTESGRWKKASRAAVEYFVDPRTYLNEQDIFALLNTSEEYAPKLDIESQKRNVRAVLAGTKFANYVDTVVKVCMEENISSAYIATLLKQENGPEVNPLNVGMSGNGTGNVLENGLNYARNNGWTDFEKGLRGGVKLVSRGYGASGQSTKHSMKFNYVTDTPSMQYMQNIEAPMHEAWSLKRTYEQSDPYLNKVTYNFLIPVFNNMPQSSSKSPDVLESEKVAVLNPGESRAEVLPNIGLRYRTEPTTRYNNAKGTFGKGTIIILEEEIKDYPNLDKTYTWFRVRTLEGRKYYIAAGFANSPERWINILETRKIEETKPKEEPKIDPVEEKTPEVKYTERIYHGKIRAKISVGEANVLRFRNMPSTKYSIIYSELPRDKEILVLSKVTPENPEGELWYKVEVNGKVGFVSKGQPGNELYFEFLDKDFMFEDEYIKYKKEKEQKELEAKKAKEEQEAREKAEIERKEKERAEEEARKKQEEEKRQKELEKANLGKNFEIKKGKFKQAVDAEVTINQGLHLRNKPTLSGSKIVKTLSKGERIKISESMGIIDESGIKYLWFKLDGKEEYISKGELNDIEYFKFLSDFEIIDETNNENTEKTKEDVKSTEDKKEETPNENKEDKIPEENQKPKIELERDVLGNNKKTYVSEYNGRTYLSLIYNITKEDLKNNLKENAKFEIKDKNGMVIANNSNYKIEDLATGNIIVIDGKECIIIKKGDINGDGLIDFTDAKIIMNIRKGKEASTIEKMAARLSVEEEYKESISSPINIQTTRDFKILLKEILKK